MTGGVDFSDALFRLGCGHVIVGCSSSDPGRQWAAGRRDGSLYCVVHAGWRLVVAVSVIRAGETAAGLWRRGGEGLAVGERSCTVIGCVTCAKEKRVAAARRGCATVPGMPDLETRVQYLETDVSYVKGRVDLAVREAAVANAAVQLVHDNVVHLAGRVDRGFTEMRESFTRVDTELAGMRGEMTEMRGEMTEMRERTSRVESLLLQVLERLPERS